MFWGDVGEAEGLVHGWLVLELWVVSEMAAGGYSGLARMRR